MTMTHLNNTIFVVYSLEMLVNPSLHLALSESQMFAYVREENFVKTVFSSLLFNQIRYSALQNERQPLMQI